MAKKKQLNEENANDENLNASNDADDTFGLPDIEYQPLNRSEEPASSDESESVQEQAQPEPVQEEPVAKEEPSYQSTSYQEKPDYHYTPPMREESSVVPRVLGILLVLVLAGGVAWYFFYYQPEMQQREKARLAQLENDRLAQREKHVRDSIDAVNAAAERHRLDSLNAIPQTGTVEKLEGRTGRYYVVVASAIDDDLIMDYANTLSKRGVNSKIIPPFGKSKFYRIAVADGGSFAEAQEIANNRKPDFTDAVWVLKY